MDFFNQLANLIMKLLFNFAILLISLSSCNKITQFSIQIPITQKVGTLSTIEIVLVSKSFIQNNVSNAQLANFELTTIRNNDIKIITSNNYGYKNCSNTSNKNVSEGNESRSSYSRPISFIQIDSTTIEMTIACYPKKFIIKGFKQTASFKLSATSLQDKEMISTVEFELNK